MCPQWKNSKIQLNSLRKKIMKSTETLLNWSKQAIVMCRVDRYIKPSSNYLLFSFKDLYFLLVFTYRNWIVQSNPIKPNTCPFWWIHVYFPTMVILNRHLKSSPTLSKKRIIQMKTNRKKIATCLLLTLIEFYFL